MLLLGHLPVNSSSITVFVLVSAHLRLSAASGVQTVYQDSGQDFGRVLRSEAKVFS